MQYRILGKTGLKVSAVGFGGIPIQRIDARGTRALMERLVEKGVNYIDTARGYTVSAIWARHCPAVCGRSSFLQRNPCPAVTRTWRGTSASA